MKKDEEEEGKIKDRKRIYINPLEISPFSQLRTSTVEDASAKGGGGAQLPANLRKAQRRVLKR